MTDHNIFEFSHICSLIQFLILYDREQIVLENYGEDCGG